MEVYVYSSNFIFVKICFCCLFVDKIKQLTTYQVSPPITHSLNEDVVIT